MAKTHGNKRKASTSTTNGAKKSKLDIKKTEPTDVNAITKNSNKSKKPNNKKINTNKNEKDHKLDENNNNNNNKNDNNNELQSDDTINTNNTTTASSAKPKKPSSNWKLLSKTLPKSKTPKTTLNDSLNEQKEKEITKTKLKNKNNILVTGSFKGATKHIAIDCEMVGVGKDKTRSELARVAVVNSFGHCIYDTFVKPVERVTDFRTHVSGVTPKDLKDAPDFKTVHKQVAALFEDKILVGHAIKHDMKVLLLSHPKRNVRDTSQFFIFRKLSHGKNPSLKMLAKRLLEIEIQEGEHSPIVDAQATMQLYKRHEKEWESHLRKKYKKKG